MNLRSEELMQFPSYAIEYQRLRAIILVILSVDTLAGDSLLSVYVAVAVVVVVVALMMLL